MNLTLAELLQRRKELQDTILKKGQTVHAAPQYMEAKTDRIAPADGTAAILASVPTLRLSQVLGEFLHLIEQLRIVDEAIQEQNWTSTVTVPACVLADFPNTDRTPMTVPLAKALLQRKKLAQMAVVQNHISNLQIYTPILSRKTVQQQTNDKPGIDEVVASLPKLKKDQVQSEFNWTASQMRTLDALIAQANWTVKIEVNDKVMVAFQDVAAPATV